MFYFIIRMELESGVVEVWPDYMDLLDIQDPKVPESLEIGKVYLSALLTAMYMLIGEGVGPVTTLEMFFVFFAMIVGAIVLSYLIGVIGNILSNANAISSKHNAKMDEVLDSMRAMKITPKLMTKIVSYYDLLWQRQRVLSTKDSFIEELSPPLRKEVHLDLNKQVIAKCLLFRGLLNPEGGSDEELRNFLTNEEAHQILVSIVDGLTPEVYLLGDPVIAQGEMGREMFFLVKGLVDIVKFNIERTSSAGSDANLDEQGQSMKKFDPLKESSGLREVSTKIVTLGAGSYFGELALLRDPIKGAFARRAASIIAVTPCDTRILTKEIFDTIVQDFPGLWSYLAKIAAEKYRMPHLLKIQIPGTAAEGVAKASNSNGNANAAVKKQSRGPDKFMAGQLTAISHQLTRVEKVITAMSRRVSNVEKCLPGLQRGGGGVASSAVSPASSAGTPSSLDSGSRSRRGSSLRGGRRGGRSSKTSRALSARRLSMPTMSPKSPSEPAFTRSDI
jgi:CRP-like cAMP-binding protein